MTTELQENKPELKGGIGNEPPAQPPEENPVDVQSLLNEMFIKHGGNLTERAEYKELLADYGLEQSQVTSQHLKVAKRNLIKFIEEEGKKQGPERDNKLEWDVEPTNFVCKDKDGKPDGTTGTRWTTKCKRYRVDFRKPMDVPQGYYTSSYLTKKGNDMWCEFAPPRENNAEGSEPRKYKTLDAALNSVEKWHCDRFKLALISSNRQQVLEVAAELGLSKPLPAPRPVAATMPVNAAQMAQGGTLPAPAPAGQPATQRAPAQRHQILGHALSRVCHWFGSKGWSFERVQRVLAHYKIAANPQSVRTYLTDGKNQKYSKPAQLSQEQVDELEKIV